MNYVNDLGRMIIDILGKYEHAYLFNATILSFYYSYTSTMGTGEMNISISTSLTFLPNF